MSLKVLCITSEFPVHPKSNRYLYLWHSLEALKQANVESVVLHTPPWKPYVNDDVDIGQFPLKISKVHYYSIPRHFFRRISNFFYLLRVVPEIRKLHKIHQFDLIHAHGEIAGLAAVSASKKLHIPSVVTIHGIDMCPRMWKGVTKKMFSKMFDRVDRIVYVGEPLQTHFRNMMKNDAHCRIVPNGFRLPSMQSASEDRLKDNQCVRLISVSNLHEGKGIDITLHALGKLKQQGMNNWFYTIIGSGDQQEYLRQIIFQYHLSDQVAFLGDCTHEEVYANLAKSDIFCLPSYREAFGIAYVEAMAHGLLTIGVKEQGPQAFIEHGKTGFLVEPKNSDSVYNVLKTAINHFEAMQDIVSAGKEHVLSQFTWRKHAEKLLGVYREVCL